MSWEDHWHHQYCQTPVLGLGLGVDFTFAGDNHNNNHNNHNHKNDNNPHLNLVKRTVLGDKEQGVGIRDKTEVEFDTEDQVLFLKYLLGQLA